MHYNYSWTLHNIVSIDYSFKQKSEFMNIII